MPDELEPTTSQEQLDQVVKVCIESVQNDSPI